MKARPQDEVMNGVGLSGDGWGPLYQIVKMKSSSDERSWRKY